MAFDDKNHLEIATFDAVGTGGADATVQALTSKAQIYNCLEAQVNSAAPTGAPTTPTLALILQGTFDETNWFTIGTFTPVTTGAGVSRIRVSRFDSAISWGLKHRLQASVGTAAGIATYAIVVRLNYIFGAAANTA